MSYVLKMFVQKALTFWLTKLNAASCEFNSKLSLLLKFGLIAVSHIFLS